MRIALLISGRGSTATAIIDACRSSSSSQSLLSFRRKPESSPSVIASLSAEGGRARQSRLEGITVACVISSRANAAGIERVIAAGIPKEKIYVASPSSFRPPLSSRAQPAPYRDTGTRDPFSPVIASLPAEGGRARQSSQLAFGEALLKILKDNAVDLIGQYGWLALTPENVIKEYKNMMINQHNGPLDPGRPDFGGKGMFGLRVSCARLLFVRRTNHDFWTEATAQRVEPLFDQGAVLKTARLPILPNDTPETLSARLLLLEHEVQIETLRDFVNNTVKEIHRPEPLIQPEEIRILEEVKEEAILRYPKG